MLSLLISLLIFCVVVGVLVWLVRLLPIPAPFGNIAVAVVVVIALLVFLERTGVLAGRL